MPDVTQILGDIERGDVSAAGELLPLVYAELRRLAAHKMRRESPGQTLQPTALVHEAFMRLVATQAKAGFENRGHFFAAAAEAMRRILIETARRKQTDKHGGKLNRCEILEADAVVDSRDIDQLLDLDDALSKLAQEDPELAKLVEMRYFAGLTIEQTASALAISPRTAKRNWAFARAWLGREMNRGFE